MDQLQCKKLISQELNTISAAFDEIKRAAHKYKKTNKQFNILEDAFYKDLIKHYNKIKLSSDIFYASCHLDGVFKESNVISKHNDYIQNLPALIKDESSDYFKFQSICKEILEDLNTIEKYIKF